MRQLFRVVNLMQIDTHSPLHTLQGSSRSTNSFTDFIFKPIMRAKGSISDVCITVLALSQIVNEVVASKCATLYNSANYQGYPVSISDGSKEPYQRHLNYVPRSVRVNKGCFLTIYDIYGNRQTLDRDFENLQWSVSR